MQAISAATREFVTDAGSQPGLSELLRGASDEAFELGAWPERFVSLGRADTVRVCFAACRIAAGQLLGLGDTAPEGIRETSDAVLAALEAWLEGPTSEAQEAVARAAAKAFATAEQREDQHPAEQPDLSLRRRLLRRDAALCCLAYACEAALNDEDEYGANATLAVTAVIGVLEDHQEPDRAAATRRALEQAAVEIRGLVLSSKP
jgi:hypothetical protein